MTVYIIIFYLFIYFLQWFKLNVFSLAFGLLMPPLFIEELTGQHMYRAGSRTPQTFADSGVGGAAAKRRHTSAVDVKG